eukprot:1853512-Prymnesium_polylepis.1
MSPLRGPSGCSRGSSCGISRAARSSLDQSMTSTPGSSTRREAAISSDARTCRTPSCAAAATSLAATALLGVSCGATATVSVGIPPSAHAQSARMCERMPQPAQQTPRLPKELRIALARRDASGHVSDATVASVLRCVSERLDECLVRCGTPVIGIEEPRPAGVRGWRAALEVRRCR